MDLIHLRRHDEIVFVQAFHYVRPPLDVLVARIPKNLVHHRPAK